MVRVIRPTIGPVKAVTQADVAAAKVPAPVDPCIIFEYAHLTTTPYPVYALDGLDDQHDIIFAGTAGWAPEDLTETFAFESGVLEHKISYKFVTYGIDTMTESFEFESAALTQEINYAAYNQGLDYLTETFAFESATLTHVIGYIFIDQPPDWMDEEHTITGITLTP